ncbi:MAG: outer membrane beta-barrel protein [Gallionella sp.]|nr:outer membrane beta-barrel protein [Gallionella sp.]
MKKSTMSIALAAALLSISAVQASEFSGGWIGAKAGSNRSDVAGVPAFGAKSADTYGFEAGYNWDMGGFLLGVDGFADFNQKATHVTVPAGTVNYGSDVYGVDVKLGLPSGNWLPYAKVGYGSARLTGAGVGSGSDAHLGLGVEYKFASQWSVAAEYTTISDKFNNKTQKLNNDNFTIGINYYFDSPAPVAAAAVVAPVVTRQVVAPAAPVVEAPKESYRTIFTDKPVTIEGTNFATNSAKLKPGADKQLAEVVDFADKNQSSGLAVTGHTDNRGSKKLNQKLSEKRAESVKAYLVKKGVAADRISTKGESFDRPVADNKTSAGRAKNRRVEITSVVREESKVRVNN